MKIIEAMKQIKMNEEKQADLRGKIGQNCAHASIETSPYGLDAKKKVEGWLQSSADLSQENVTLLCAIQRTNLATNVTIELGGKKVTKSIAEWVWRRRKYANMDESAWSQLTDRGVKEGSFRMTEGGEPVEVAIIRYYNPSDRDDKVSMYREEPHRIDATLEVVNATTDLME